VLRLKPVVVALKSFVRGSPLFLSASPRTPLRVLCIMAFDTLHMLRHSTPLPRDKLRLLAALLDFGACANAAFDDKDCCWNKCRATLQLLDEAGVRSLATEHLRRLKDLESGRPLPGSEDWQFQTVCTYREAVVRLSLGMLATATLGYQELDEAICATHRDADLNLLFRMAMQCQIIDDVLDYPQDLYGGLPSFLTASESLPQAFELTRSAALTYAGDDDLTRSSDVFALRYALVLVSLCTKLVMALGRWGHHPCRANGEWRQDCLVTI
jgi:hypothetical protein